MQAPVVIIGAGLAGLTAAYRLHQKGFSVQVYEARRRIGGRVLTIKLKDQIAELGGQNILDGDQATHLKHLIQEFNLEVEEGQVPLNFHYHTGQQLLHIRDISGAPARTSQVKEHRNMEEVLSSLFPQESLLYKIFHLRLMGYEGLPLQKLSPFYTDLLDHMIAGALTLNQEEVTSYPYMMIKGGNITLLERLGRDLTDSIHLDMSLQSLTKTDANKYRLTFNNNHSIEAERVVLTMPCGTYKNIDFINHPIPDKQLEDIKSVSYGTSSKILVPNDPQLYRIGGFSNDQVMVYSLANPHIVTMYCAGDFGRFSKPDLPTIYHNTLPLLEAAYHNKAHATLTPVYADDTLLANYDQPVGYSWANDPYAQGSYSCVGVGQDEMYLETITDQGYPTKKLFTPVNQRIFFAGEHTSLLQDAIGTMEAAVESGNRIAEMIAQG